MLMVVQEQLSGSASCFLIQTWQMRGDEVETEPKLCEFGEQEKGVFKAEAV